MTAMWLPILAAIATWFAPPVHAEETTREVPLRTHSLAIPYLDQDFHSRWWDYGGTTVINTAKHIRLTHDRQHATGTLWSRLPITATNYEIEIEFKIGGTGASLFGDGFALWLTSDRAIMGPVFGNKDEFEGLGVFFDTYRNGRRDVGFPYVSAMLGDGRTKYDRDNDGQNTELAGCPARSIRNGEASSKARLTYFKDRFLKLELYQGDNGQWEECFKVDSVDIPNVVYLGFTAITGEVHDNHDLISVTSKNIFSSETYPSKPDKKARRAAKKAGSGSSSGGFFSWVWTFVKFVMLAGTIYGAYLGWRRYKDGSKKQYLGY